MSKDYVCLIPWNSGVPGTSERHSINDLHSASSGMTPVTYRRNMWLSFFRSIMKILQTFFLGWNSALFFFHLFPHLETASDQEYLNSLWVTISKWYQLDDDSLKWYETRLFSFLGDMKDFCSCHCLLLLSPPLFLSLPLLSTPPLLTVWWEGVFITRFMFKFLATNQVCWLMPVFPELTKMAQKTFNQGYLGSFRPARATETLSTSYL